MDLGFHLALSYQDLKHPTSRQNFANIVGQNHALILTQCHILFCIRKFFVLLQKENLQGTLQRPVPSWFRPVIQSFDKTGDIIVKNKDGDLDENGGRR